MWTAIAKFLAALWDYIRDRQLINSGKAEAERDVLENSNKAQETAKQTVIDVGNLDSEQLAARLREWRKPKK